MEALREGTMVTGSELARLEETVAIITATLSRAQAENDSLTREREQEKEGSRQIVNDNRDDYSIRKLERIVQLHAECQLHTDHMLAKNSELKHGPELHTKAHRHTLNDAAESSKTEIYDDLDDTLKEVHRLHEEQMLAAKGPAHTHVEGPDRKK